MSECVSDAVVGFWAGYRFFWTEAVGRPLRSFGRPPAGEVNLLGNRYEGLWPDCRRTDQAAQGPADGGMIAGGRTKLRKARPTAV